MNSSTQLSGYQVVRLEYPFPVTAELLYSAIRELPSPVMLSSGNNLGISGRYDILTAAPLYLLETKGTETCIFGPDKQVQYSEDNPIATLKALSGKVYITDQPTLPDLPFCGGVVGYFAYDLLHPWYGIEPVAKQDISLPGMQAGLYLWSVILDRLEGTVSFAALPDCPQSLADEVLSKLSPEAVSKLAEPDTSAFSLTAPFQSNVTAQEYDAAFRQVIDYINAGDCYQVNLAQRFTANYQGDFLAAFTRLQKLANAPFAALMERDNAAVLSFSPERFLRVENLSVLTQPIKGTRPRHLDPVKDGELLESLLNSKKDQAENLMIVDLLRNDLGRVCKTGSVHVPALFEAQSFNNVHHLVSTVAGTLNKPSDVFDLFAASFPGGSITGAPKIRAMEIINELENRPRSVYCGSIAWFSPEGNMDSNICIRTLVCSDQQVHCWGGGGVVADSKSELEYQETLDKITLFLSGLNDAS